MSVVFFAVHWVAPLWLGLLWLGSARAVTLDARARLANRDAVRTASLAALLLPFVGAALYVCVRPAETRDERRSRRLATLLLELELAAAVEPEPAPEPVEAEPEVLVPFPARVPAVAAERVAAV